jgi:regulatory protein
MPNDTDRPPPDAGRLYQLALSHLANYATTAAGLRRVLMRRVDRWARSQSDAEAAAPAAAAHASIEGVIERLVKTGAVSDAAFAESRAKGLIRSGLSNRAVQARLVAKGVAPDVARAASASATDAESELAAALILVRKRRIGTYRAVAEADAAVRMKEMGVLARAGFSRDIAEQALKMSSEEAESRIHDLRR